MVDPLLEELIEMATDGATFLGLTAAITGTVIAGAYSISRVCRRRELVKHYKDPCYEGRLKVKPNIFNIRRITSTEPRYKDKYWVKRDKKYEF